MSKRIVLLGGSDKALLERADEMGLRAVVIADREPVGPYEIWISADCYNESLSLQATADLQDIEAVMCAGVDAPDVAAAIAERLGGPPAANTPIAETAAFSKNKWAQHELLVQNYVRVPDAGLWDGRGPILCGNAMVLKPGNARGALGVYHYAEDEIIPKSAYQQVAAHGLPVLFQSWIDGPQLSSESLVQDGEILWSAYAQRNYSRLEEFAPHVIEDGCDMPPMLIDWGDPGWRNLADIELQKCVTALGLKRGTLKGDLVWDGGRIWIIEVAARLGGGGLASEMIPRVWGVDFAGMALRLALGDYIWPGEIRPWRRCRATQRYEFPRQPLCHQDRGGYEVEYEYSR